MVITHEMISITRERMASMPVDYRRYMDTPMLEYSSVGLVARFGGNKTSKTYKITKLTEAIAIEHANRSEDDIIRLAWLECAWSVFTKLMTGRSGSAAAVRKNQKIAHIMHLHVFLGWTFARIASEPLPRSDEIVSRQRIYKLYSDAVELVAEEAYRRKLFPEPQA